MRRLEVIDGLRGYFLIGMFLNHVYFTGGFAPARYTHSELGFVQDAQGFVFLSGLLVGLVYGRKMMKLGFIGGSQALWLRARELYVYTLVCMAVLLLLRLVLPQAAELWDMWLGPFGEGRLGFMAAAAVLLYQPIYIDILPQYIVYFIVAPPLVWLSLRGSWLAVLVGSAILWLGVQTGLHLPLSDALGAMLRGLDADLFVQVPFNVLAWQIVFMTALVIGALWARDQIDSDRIFDPRKTSLAKVSAAVLLFFMAFRLGFRFEIVPDEVMTRFQVYENRPEFGVVFLLNFVFLGYLTAWLMIAGPKAENPFVALLGRGLNGFFSLSLLRLLGRHSLQIYVWHVLLVYLLVWVDGVVGPFDESVKVAIVAASVGLLTLPALYAERRLARRTRSSEPQRTRASESQAAG